MMADLFDEKAADWDAGDLKQKLSNAIGSSIVDRVNLEANMQVMDFGAGTGLISSLVAPHVKSITAVDISPAMLAKLAEKPEFKGKAVTVCQDILEQPLDTKFDLIISAMAMHHVEDTDKMIQTFASHLNAAGMVALADLDKEDGSFHPADIEGVHHAGFDQDTLKVKFEHAGFKDVQFQTAITVYKEDKAYPVFLMIAKKG
ncbi:MAG: class I SAM-dependent methyltransferase [Ghiorsea sp.]